MQELKDEMTKLEKKNDGGCRDETPESQVWGLAEQVKME